MIQTMSFEQTGQAWFRSALRKDDLDKVGDWADMADKPGQRINAQMPDSAVQTILHLVRKCLPSATLVRAVAFNKSADTNWSVPWHQDRVIALEDRRDVVGFGNWSRKEGVWHCEPPLEVLEGMVFARLHLDAATTQNGCMEIAPGSHRRGVIPAADANECASDLGAEPCLAQRGDLQVLKMLTLHRSRPALDPSPRRAVRLDFATMTLPEPLKWWSADVSRRG